MNDDLLKKMFDSLPATPCAEAKARARAAALQAFDEANAEPEAIHATRQGSAEPRRPIPDNTKQGINIMSGTIARERQAHWQYVGLAAAVLLTLWAVIAQQTHHRNDVAPPPAIAVVDEPIEKTPPAVVRKEEKPQPPVVASNGAAPAAETATVDAARASQPHTPDSKRARPAPRVAVASDTATKTPRAASNAGAPDETVPPLRVASVDVPQNGRLEEVTVTAQRRPEPPTELGMAIQAFSSNEATVSFVPDSVESSNQRRDRFASANSNPVKKVSVEPVSTFSIDVDTASYSFVRRQLNQGFLPDQAAVRLEEMVNYFPYAYTPPEKPARPFRAQVAVIDAPWKPGNKLLHIGIKGYELQGKKPKSNLVFLLDVSGSMNGPDRLPLVKQSMQMLLTRLQPEDTVAIVVYAGAVGTVLEPTEVKEKEKILAALDKLTAGGSTAGGEGILRAYQLAESSFIKDGVNRIILATDGDFNVGVSDAGALQRLVERKRKSGVFLSVLGFGQDNYNDELMQKLAQNGNGVAAYIDTLSEAQKVLVNEATSTLFPIAKDVKIQVEFNPATVSEYRLLGYETRMLAEEDFNNDAVDAGDIGSGHTVTAIYEITPKGSASAVFSPSRYSDTARGRGGKGNEYGFLKLRYKLPKKYFSKLIEEPIKLDAKPDGVALQETRFAAAVAGFAQLLQGGKYLGDWNYENALELAMANRGDDPFGYRAELVELIRKAELADRKNAVPVPTGE